MIGDYDIYSSLRGILSVIRQLKGESYTKGNFSIPFCVRDTVLIFALDSFGEGCVIALDIAKAFDRFDTAKLPFGFISWTSSFIGCVGEYAHCIPCMS